MKIGILGGIRPEATGYFYVSLISKLKCSGLKKRNKDYPQFVINSINAPELVSSEISDSEIKPYVDGIKELALHQPDFIVMVCNTIHVYRDLLIEKSGFNKILSLRDIVREELNKVPLPICILATPSTLKNKLFYYDDSNYTNLEKEDLEEISQIVVDFNATRGERSKQRKINDNS